MPRIKLDLTADERIVLPPVTRARYSTLQRRARKEASTFSPTPTRKRSARRSGRCAERTRPRDLYDVVSLFRNAEARPAPAVLLDVLAPEMRVQGHRGPAPCRSRAAPNRARRRMGNTCCAHQLPSLPPLESFWDEMPAFFAWLEGGAAPAILAALRRRRGRSRSARPRARLPLAGAVRRSRSSASRRRTGLRSNSTIKDRHGASNLIRSAARARETSFCTRITSTRTSTAAIASIASPARGQQTRPSPRASRSS